MIGAIAASQSYGGFVGHDELSRVHRTVVPGELCWLIAQWPRCVLQSCREWRIWVICASRRWDVAVLEGMNGSNVMDLVLMRSPHRRLLFMIGLSTCTFLLHFDNFCLHGRYFALGIG